jgi:hypothetical protein
MRLLDPQAEAAQRKLRIFDDRAIGIALDRLPGSVGRFGRDALE